jgi:hypothetical protein
VACLGRSQGRLGYRQGDSLSGTSDVCRSNEGRARAWLIET